MLSIDLFVSLLRGYKSVRNEEFALGLENLEHMYLWYAYSKDRTLQTKYQRRTLGENIITRFFSRSLDLLL